MSHSVIIIGRDGESYEYFPPHTGERSTADSFPNIVAYCEAKKIKLKDVRPQAEMPPDLLAEVEELLS